MEYIILYKNEFIVLLNNHEVAIPIEERTVSKNSEPNKDELIEKLINLPQFDYDEDILLVKSNIETGNIVNIENVSELIPLTEKALLAYRRKFNVGLIFTENKVNSYDSIYQEYRKERIRKETKKSVILFEKFFLKKCNIIEDEFLNKLIDAKIEKVIYGKKDTDIKANEYDYFLQSLSIYEDGSHLNRTYPIGFAMHAFAAMFYHLGNQTNKNNLHKVSQVLREIIADTQNNSYLSLEGASSYIDNLSESNSNFRKALDSFKNCSDTKYQIGNPLKTTMYALYFRYLLEVEKLSWLELREVFLSLKIRALTREIEIALILNVIYFPFTKISDDILRLNDGISIFVDEINYDHLYIKIDLISRFLTNTHQIEVKNLYNEYEVKVNSLKNDGYTNTFLTNNMKQVVMSSTTLTNPLTKTEETWHLVKPNDNNFQFDMFRETKSETGNRKFDTTSVWEKKIIIDMKKIIDEKNLKSIEEIDKKDFEKMKDKYKVYLKKVNPQSRLRYDTAKNLMVKIYQNYNS